MNLKINDKARGQKIHAKQRFFERFGVELNRINYNNAIEQIQNGKAKKLQEQSRRLRVYLINILGIDCKAVYDRQRKTIVTFFPPDFEIIWNNWDKE